jgi:hypothetical protein
LREKNGANKIWRKLKKIKLFSNQSEGEILKLFD